MDTAWAIPYPERVPWAERDRLLAWQEDSVTRSVAYVKSLNDVAGGACVNADVIADQFAFDTASHAGYAR